MRPAGSSILPDPPFPANAKVNTHVQTFLRYAGVVASVTVAALVRVPLRPVLGNKVAFITLFPAIVYSAWVAGFGGGLLATILSAFIVAWFIFSPTTSLLVADPADKFSLIVFILVGIAISVLGQAQHHAQRRAEASARDADQSAMLAERSAAQQRAFLHDVLLSVTEGRLHLCHSSSDLPDPLPGCGVPVPVSRTGGIAELRAQARQAAVARGFADERWHDLVTATGEAAMNAVVHGGGGQSRVCGDADTIQVWVEDQGAGIDMTSLPRATLEKGYSSAGTLGHGMKMMLQTADRVWLLTSSTGTTVVLEQDRLPHAPKGLP